MSWAIKLAGTRQAVASALRNYKTRPGMYPDQQRDALFDSAAAQVEGMTNTGYQGVVVEGNGHQWSNFSLRVDNCEVVEEVKAVSDPVDSSAAASHDQTTAAPSAPA